MNPPVTWNAKNPSNHRTIRTAASIASILDSFFIGSPPTTDRGHCLHAQHSNRLAAN